MLQLFKRLLGGKKSSPDYRTLKAIGAQIVDVRSAEEFATGHIPGAINIPVQALAQHLPHLDKEKAIITCCASGMRSANARKFLLCRGYKKVHDGGGWVQLNRKLQ